MRGKITVRDDAPRSASGIMIRCALALRSRCTSCATNLLPSEERKRRVKHGGVLSPSYISRFELHPSPEKRRKKEGMGRNERKRERGSCHDKLSSETTAEKKNKSGDALNDELT